VWPKIETRAKIINLKDRSFAMLKKDLILRNPLSFLADNSQTLLQPGEFGAISARAGVGKTAFIVQLSLHSLLQNHSVLHISLNEPISKVSLWYQEVFQHLAPQYNAEQMQRLWDTIIPHRFIMTFNTEGFLVATLEERLTDLSEQNIFSPRLIIIDGFPFDHARQEELQNMRSLSQKYASPIWFTIRTHRTQPAEVEEGPSSLKQMAELFSMIIQLQPQRDEIIVKVIKGPPAPKDDRQLFLDPSTMLIKDKL